MRHFLSDRWSSSLSRPPKKAASAGFTLVEMLAVVVIISMLAALMLPALVGARARARIAQCCHNQSELGKAILQYEVAKNKLPGYANHITTGTSSTSAVGYTVSWVPVLFPYMGRMDLWEGDSASGVVGWRRVGVGVSTSKPMAVAKIPLLVCPDDEQEADYPLSYVVSVGTATDDPTSGLETQTNLFRNLSLFSQKAITLSSVKSPSRRPMLSERAFPLGGVKANRDWTFRGTQSEPMVASLGFRWPMLAATAGTTSVSGPFIEAVPNNHPIHAGIVNITFCDGHTESVSLDTMCDAFDYAPITQ
ncbi:MAG: DUF1559 domain-containing protein [Thermoguttaceae bacterium]